jgi:hypothetical protein
MSEKERRVDGKPHDFEALSGSQRSKKMLRKIRCTSLLTSKM